MDTFTADLVVEQVRGTSQVLARHPPDTVDREGTEALVQSFMTSYAVIRDAWNGLLDLLQQEGLEAGRLRVRLTGFEEMVSPWVKLAPTVIDYAQALNRRTGKPISRLPQLEEALRQMQSVETSLRDMVATMNQPGPDPEMLAERVRNFTPGKQRSVADMLAEMTGKKA